MRRLRRTPEGFSLLEVTIAVALSSIVVTALAGVLMSQSKAERRVGAFANNQEEVRQAMVALQRDLRSAEPLLTLGSSADYALRVDLSIYEEIDSPAPIQVTWRVDTSTSSLLREEPDGSGGSVTTYRLQGVANSASQPLFSFYKANGGALVPGSDVPADIAACASRIHLNLVAAPDREAGPARLDSDVQLRNRQTGTGCPLASVLP